MTEEQERQEIAMNIAAAVANGAISHQEAEEARKALLGRKEQT